MRNIKAPEVRKLEIMDCAMELFAQKGYENTTMNDIARELSIAVGLCYHYFSSKQILYCEALSSYAKSCTVDFTAVFQKGLPLEECRTELRQCLAAIEEKAKYHEFFDKNKEFHNQLDRAIAEEMMPYVVEYLKVLNARGEISVEHPEIIAAFILYGEIPILSNEEMSMDNRISIIQGIIEKLLK